jgi:hypothetical protein
MTVKELKAALNQLDENLPIVMEGIKNFSNIASVKTESAYSQKVAILVRRF